jgi:hypothetical protein
LLEVQPTVYVDCIDEVEFLMARLAVYMDWIGDDIRM